MPGQINPLQEAKAHEVEVKNAFRTRADAASIYDNEFDNMVEEWGEQERQWKELPLTEQEKIIQEGLNNA